jgi:hypothetical protein
MGCNGPLKHDLIQGVSQDITSYPHHYHIPQFTVTVVLVHLCTAGTACYFRKYILRKRVIPAIHHFKDGTK